MPMEPLVGEVRQIDGRPFELALRFNVSMNCGDSAIDFLRGMRKVPEAFG